MEESTALIRGMQGNLMWKQDFAPEKPQEIHSKKSSFSSQWNGLKMNVMHARSQNE